ncbi:MAG: hypothetical protein LBL65_05445 [Campylobacteraceae bacterium]|jgi:hypothetical protein|nr:hypothetical protein [Campylobacteraceae bacterium]
MRYTEFIILLIVLVLIPITVINGFIYAYKKLSRPHFFLLLFSLIAIPFTFFKIYERGFMLDAVPDALHVNSISYSKEESWGFGPSGNEAGIRVYPLPANVADEILRQGIEFFNNLPPNKNQKNRGWNGKYEKWYQTPTGVNDRWQPKEETGALDIYDYICVYGFCIKIDDAVVKQATEIVNSEGSYYAYGRIGLIVVSPGKKLVLYMYNG